MKTDAPSPLIELLAHTDTIWWPVRDWSNNARVCAIVEKREEFRRHGLPYRVGGDGAERKRHERFADDLEASGHAEFSRRHGKRIGWRLSEIGDWKIRSLVGSYRTGPMLVALLSLRAFSDVTNAAMIPEVWLLGCGYDRPDVARRAARLAEMFSPAMVRGFADSHSDAEGRVAYTLTSAGRAVLDGDALPGDDELPTYSESAGDVYERCLDAAREELATAQPTRDNSVAIPLPCGDWPEERPAIPSVFAQDGAVRTPAAMQAAIRRANTKHAARCRKTKPSRKEKECR